jgi:flagellar hook-associated protein 1 FlgK
MAGLLDSLSSATSGLRAAQLGLEVTGHNIANINTLGYSRRTIDLAGLAPVDQFSAGRGVEVLGVRAQRDELVQARVSREQAGLAKDAAILGGAVSIEGLIGSPGSSIDGNLTAFFDAFAGFSVDVTSAPARDNVVSQGQSLARAFNQFASALSAEAASADRSIRSGVQELNQLAQRVASLNANIAVGGADVDSLKDERGVVLARMSELADVSVIPGDNGTVSVTLAGGRAVVVGAYTYDVQMVSNPPSGHASLLLGGTDITATLTNGQIGGLIELRDAVIPAYTARLDQMAHDLATAVNTAHTAGFDGTGAAAGNFFVPPATVAGAAQSLSVEAALLSDSQGVAGSATGAAGDNQIALAIAGLRNARVIGGNTETPADAWSNLVYEVGSDVSTARAVSSTREQVVRQLERLREQVSGVSLDEEAANLMRYQRSYEASARYFTTVVDTLDTLMSMV